MNNRIISSVTILSLFLPSLALAEEELLEDQSSATQTADEVCNEMLGYTLDESIGNPVNTTRYRQCLNSQRQKLRKVRIYQTQAEKRASDMERAHNLSARYKSLLEGTTSNAVLRRQLATKTRLSPREVVSRAKVLNVIRANRVRVRDLEKQTYEQRQIEEKKAYDERIQTCLDKRNNRRWLCINSRSQRRNLVVPQETEEN